MRRLPFVNNLGNSDWLESKLDKPLNFILFQEPARRKSYAEILNGDDEEDEKVQMSKDKTNIYKNMQRWSLLWGRQKNALSSDWMKGSRTIYQGRTTIKCLPFQLQIIIALQVPAKEWRDDEDGMGQ